MFVRERARRWTFIDNRLRRLLDGSQTERTNNERIERLGCSIYQYKCYIEGRFTVPNGFTWNNWKTVWQIDHKTAFMSQVDGPVTMDLLHQRKHYTNTEPIFVEDNMSKGNR
jgi:hypothetical protein